MTDASGAVISSATVKTTNTGNGVSRSAVTDASGHYDLEALSLGGYEIRVSKSGFADALRTGVSLEVAEAAVIDFSLKVGDTSQSVTIDADAPQVSVTTASTAGLIGERQVRELPLERAELR